MLPETTNRPTVWCREAVRTRNGGAHQRLVVVRHCDVEKQVGQL